jgi:hypothetical protein
MHPVTCTCLHLTLTDAMLCRLGGGLDVQLSGRYTGTDRPLTVHDDKHQVMMFTPGNPPRKIGPEYYLGSMRTYHIGCKRLQLPKTRASYTLTDVTNARGDLG